MGVFFFFGGGPHPLPLWSKDPFLSLLFLWWCTMDIPTRARLLCVCMENNDPTFWGREKQKNNNNNNKKKNKKKKNKKSLEAPLPPAHRLFQLGLVAGAASIMTKKKHTLLVSTLKYVLSTPSTRFLAAKGRRRRSFASISSDNCTRDASGLPYYNCSKAQFIPT